MADEETAYRLGALELSLAIACVVSLIVFSPALVVLVPGLIGVLFWRAFQVGRPKAQRSCVRCGYVIEGLKGTMCPECGTTFLNPDAERIRIDVRQRERAKG